LTCVTDKSFGGVITEECAAGQKICFKNWKKMGPKLYDVKRGCTATCPKADDNGCVKCCNTDKCNK
nr:Chain A, Synergistic-type venom protein S2C4 [Dendroaspis jamesoni kaimosae]7C28_B Chain B, Synergistic-type venom protein S2C4 [Dendroaspis jamesoni kaimosae]